MNKWSINSVADAYVCVCVCLVQVGGLRTVLANVSLM